MMVTSLKKMGIILIQQTLNHGGHISLETDIIIHLI